MPDSTGQGSVEPRNNCCKNGQKTTGIGCKNHNQSRDENEAPFFELGDASIGFAGLCVDGFQLFINSVEALLAAVRQITHWRLMIADCRFHDGLQVRGQKTSLRDDGGDEAVGNDKGVADLYDAVGGDAGCAQQIAPVGIAFIYDAQVVCGIFSNMPLDPC
jgi:hypothetical protein